MFFWDAANKKKTFILEKDYTIQSKRKYYELSPVTVYLLVWQVLFIYLFFEGGGGGGSFEFCKTRTKVITLGNHKEQRETLEPIRS